MFVQEIRKHLTEDLIPFWEKLKDEEYGGFYGVVDHDLVVHPDAIKGGILNSRILWFFSNCATVLKSDAYLKDAEYAYRILRDHFIDKEYGGVYWSVERDGTPADTQKHSYNQGFAIYGLSSYYEASGNEEARGLAMELYRLVETHMRDDQGYLEAFNRDLTPASNEKLAEGTAAYRTMNSLLHLLEGYTELYRVTKDEDVRKSICYMLDIVAEHIYNPALERLECFFDADYHTLQDLHSYGHDIEASWLVERTLEILDDPVYTAKVKPALISIMKNTLAKGFSGDYLYNDCLEGRQDRTAVWWVQAETTVGLLNAYKNFPEEKDYYEKALRVWEFIKNTVIDRRPGCGEWKSEVLTDGTDRGLALVSLWKCLYHNGRMCLEVIKRLGA